MEEFQCAQVSMNIMDYRKTGFATVYEMIRQLANKLGTDVAGSELIGLVPKQALIDAGKYYLPDETQETVLLKKAVVELGFDAVEEFDYKNRIIEYLI